MLVPYLNTSSKPLLFPPEQSVKIFCYPPVFLFSFPIHQFKIRTRINTIVGVMPLNAINTRIKKVYLCQLGSRTFLQYFFNSKMAVWQIVLLSKCEWSVSVKKSYCNGDKGSPKQLQSAVQWEEPVTAAAILHLEAMEGVYNNKNNDQIY